MREISRTRLNTDMLAVSDFYQESVVAFDSGLFFEFWDKSPEEQAWIRAIYETKGEIEQVADYARKIDND